MDNKIQELKELLKELDFGEIVSGLLTLRYEQYREVARILIEKADNLESEARFDAEIERQKELERPYKPEVKPEPEVHGDPYEELNNGVTPNSHGY